MWLGTRVPNQPPAEATNILGRSPKKIDFQNHPPAWYKKFQAKRKSHEEASDAAPSKLTKPLSHSKNRNEQQSAGSKQLPIELGSSLSCLRSTDTASHSQNKHNESLHSESNDFSPDSSTESEPSAGDGFEQGSVESFATGLTQNGADLQLSVVRSPKNCGDESLSSNSSDSGFNSSVREGGGEGALDELEVSVDHQHAHAEFADRPSTLFNHAPRPDIEAGSEIDVAEVTADKGQQVQAARRLASFTKDILSDMVS